MSTLRLLSGTAIWTSTGSSTSASFFPLLLKHDHVECVAATRMNSTMHSVGSIHALSMYDFRVAWFVRTREVRHSAKPNTPLNNERKILIRCFWTAFCRDRC